jgi:hypothetical protein
MDRKIEQPDHQTNARRRLLRGAFSAPVIMTVPTGSALAGSSNLRCIAKQGDFFPEVSTSRTEGNYFRIEVKKIGSKLYVLGVDIKDDIRSVVKTVYMSTAEVHEFNPDTNRTVTLLPVAQPNATPNSLQTPQWAALRFDENGNVVGVGKPPVPNTGWGVTGSCWGSFVKPPV